MTVDRLAYQPSIIVMMIGRRHQQWSNRKLNRNFSFDLEMKSFFAIYSLSPNNDNSSESGSESTSPSQTSSEESSSAKVENSQEKKTWCLSSFAPKKAAKSTQPSQDSQPAVANIKHEPNVIDDDNDLYNAQMMPNSMNPMKDMYQQQTLTNNYDSKSQLSQNNCELNVDTIKQEPPGKCLCDLSIFCLHFFFLCHIR